MATMDFYGALVISEVNTNDYIFHLDTESNIAGRLLGKLSVFLLPQFYDYLVDMYGCCRWSPNIGEPLLFTKYNHNKLNILDVEKRGLTLNVPIQTERRGKRVLYIFISFFNPFKGYYTYWIDVCPNDGNLLVAVGEDKNIKVYDKRVSEIVQTFESLHSSKSH